MSIGDRIKYIRKKMDISQKDFSEAVDVSQGRLSDIEKDKNKPSVDTVISISGYSGFSTDWILSGKEVVKQITLDQQELIEAYEKLDKDKQFTLKAYVAFLLSFDISGQAPNYTDKKATAPDPPSIKEERSVYLPILGTAAAGMPIMTDELLEGFLPVPAAKIKKNTYLIRVRGDSMIEANIHDGDLVIINPQPSVENGEIALVRVDGEVTIKKFYRDDFCIRLKPANSSLDDIVVSDLSKIKTLGKVLGVIPAEEVRKNMLQEFNGPNK